MFSRWIATFFIGVGMSPWLAARRLFRDRSDLHQPDDRIRALSMGRSVLGIAGTFLVTLGYETSTVFDTLNVFEGVVELVLMTIVAVPVAVGVLYAVASAADRPRLRARSRSPLLTIALLLATIPAPAGLFLLLVRVGVVVPRGLFDRGQDFGVEMVLVLLIVWWFVYCFAALNHIGQSALSVREVHPMLAPICAVVAVAGKAVLNVVLGDFDGLPAGLWMVLTTVGVLSVAAVGTVELRLLRRSGWRLP